LVGAEVELAEGARREFRLRDALSVWRQAAPFRYILIDCPPSLGLLTLNALVAADGVLVPLQCEFYALEGVSGLTRTIEMVRRRLNPSLRLCGVVLTMYDKRNNLSDLVAEDARGFFGEWVYETVIPRNVRLSEAPSHGVPVFEYDPKSAGALAYAQLAEELVRRDGIPGAPRDVSKSEIAT
jgi:chromosome partitioning protein